MHPSLLISMLVAAGVAGSLFYSYHVGRTQGEAICEAELYQAKLKQAQEELVNEQALSKLQKDQIGEAQNRLTLETKLNAQLKEDLDRAVAVKSPGCITPGMLDAIKKYRATTDGKNP